MDILQSTDFWVLVSFLLFIGLVGYYGKGVILSTIDGRIERIRAEITQAESLKEEASAKLAELKRMQRDASEQSEQIVEAAKAETKAMKKEQDARFKETMDRREKQAMDKIAQAEANAIAEVRAQAADIAVAAAAQVLSERMAGAEGDKAIDDAVKAIPQKLH